MVDKGFDWKKDLITDLEGSLAFFSNKEKLNREKWVVNRLLSALQIDFKQEEINGSEEPADVSFREANFQVKEVLDEGRRRTDEYKAKLEKVKTAKSYSDLLEHYSPEDISFSEVVAHCLSYVENLESNCKYGKREQKKLDLLVCFNWHNYHIVKPTEIQSKILGFRSLSVVSNRYCAVVYANESAPLFLKVNIGKVGEYIG